MRTLIVGDLQIDAYDMTGDRAVQSRETLAWIINLIDQYKPEMFVHLGDLGESNRGVDHYTLTLLSWFIGEVGKRMPAGRSFWLVGNHDYFTDDGKINLMSALAGLIEPQGHVVCWPWKTGPEGTLFCSYLKGGDRFRADHGLLFEQREQSVLFCHFPITGAMFGASRFEKDGFDPNQLPRYTFVGHYHAPNYPDPVQMGFGNVIWFCGSPMGHDFRDNIYGLKPEQQTRGVWFTDVEKGVVTVNPILIPNPHCHYFLSFSPQVTELGITDPWMQSCAVPWNQINVRASVPAADMQRTKELLTPYVRSLEVLPAEARAVAPSSDIATNPQLNPQMESDAAVSQFVDSLQEKQLAGLDRETLKQVGTGLLSTGTS